MLDSRHGFDELADEEVLGLERHRREGQRALELDVLANVDRRKATNDVIGFGGKMVASLKMTTAFLRVFSPLAQFGCHG